MSLLGHTYIHHTQINTYRYTHTHTILLIGDLQKRRKAWEGMGNKWRIQQWKSIPNSSPTEHPTSIPTENWRASAYAAWQFLVRMVTPSPMKVTWQSDPPCTTNFDMHAIVTCLIGAHEFLMREWLRLRPSSPSVNWIACTRTWTFDLNAPAALPDTETNNMPPCCWWKRTRFPRPLDFYRLALAMNEGINAPRLKIRN